MAYNTQELKARCIKAASDKQKNFHFLEDIYVEVGISVPTFYEHFPKDSKDYKDIVDCLRKNRIRTKQKLRTKWLDSENASLQLALMKLIGNNRDRNRLVKTQHELTGKDGESLFSTPKLVMEIVDPNEIEPETTSNS